MTILSPKPPVSEVVSELIQTVKKKTHEIKVGDTLVLSYSFIENQKIFTKMYDSDAKNAIFSITNKNSILFEIDDIDIEYLNAKIADLYDEDDEDIKPEHSKYSFYQIENLFDSGFSIHLDGTVDFEWDVIED